MSHVESICSRGFRGRPLEKTEGGEAERPVLPPLPGGKRPGRSVFRSLETPSSERGAVLIIALVVLVAMTLSALSLIRSVNTTNLISGNLAFRESAILSSERGTEAALNDWLLPNSAPSKTALHNDSKEHGYLATRVDPKTGEKWETFWNDTLDGQSVTIAEDAAGNTISYVIHRLCEKPGAPYLANCSRRRSDAGATHDLAKAPLGTDNQIYYRITSRVKGPRDTVVYTQTVIAL